MPYFDKTGWVVTVSAMPERAYILTDGIDYYQPPFFAHLWWSGESGPSPAWIAVDMGTAQLMDFIRWQPDTVWGWAPRTAKAYTSDDGITWTLQATTPPLYPITQEDQFIYFDTPVSTRYWKLEFTESGGNGDACDEIWAGLRVAGEVYKIYWKTYPRQCLGFYVPPLDSGDPTSQHYPTTPVSTGGQIDSLSCSTTTAEMSMRIWHTSGVSWYPETVFWDWYAPPNLGDLTIESKTLVAVYNRTDASTLGTFADFRLSNSNASVQSYFDFIYAWYYSNESGDVIARAEVTSLTAVQLVALYSHAYHWASIYQNSPDHTVDVARLTLSDHYLLLVYSGEYSPPPPPEEHQDFIVPGECFYLLVDNPLDRRTVTLDWSRWLGTGDGILTAAWTADAGLVVWDLSKSSTTATATFSTPGAATGDSFLLRCQVTTEKGRTEMRSIQVEIRATAGTAHTEAAWWRL